MKTLEQILAEHRFFRDMPPAYLRLAAGCAVNKRFEAGQLLCREGEDADYFYVISRGSAAIEIFAPGRGPITIQSLGEGDMAGYSWLIAPYKYRLDVRAVEPVLAVAFDGKCLREKCEANPALGYDFLKRVTQVVIARLGATRLQLLDIYGKDLF